MIYVVIGESAGVVNFGVAGVSRALRRVRIAVYVAHLSCSEKAVMACLLLIWVTDPQFAKYFDLIFYHQGGIKVTIVVIPQEMQHRVHQ